MNEALPAEPSIGMVAVVVDHATGDLRMRLVDVDIYQARTLLQLALCRVRDEMPDMLFEDEEYDTEGVE